MSGLQPTVVHIAAGVGIDEATRDEHLQLGEANRAIVNGRFDRDRAIVTRPGFRKLSATRLDATTRTAGRKMFARGQAICVLDHNTLDSYAPGLGVNTSAGRVPEVLATRYPIVGMTSAGATQDPALAYANGLYFLMTAESDNPGTTVVIMRINVYVVDPATKAVVKSYNGVTTGLSTPIQPKMVAVGNRVVLFYNTSATTIVAKTLDATSAATLTTGWSGATSITTTWSGNDYDVCGMATKAAIAYTSSSGVANRLFVATINPTTLATVASGNPVNTSANLLSVAIDGSESDFLWVGWTRSDQATVNVVGIDPTAITVTSTSAVCATAQANAPTRVGIVRTSASGGHVVAKGATGVGHWNQVMSRPFLNVAGAVTPQDSKMDNWGWTPNLHPFVLDSRVYSLQGASSDDASPANAVLFDVTLSDPAQVTASAAVSRGPVKPVAVPARGNCAYAQQATLSTQRAVTVSATKVVAPVCIQTNASNGASIATAVELVEFVTKDARMWQTVEHNGLTCLSGGLLMGYDGQAVFEVGFVSTPSVRVGLSGAGVIGTGVTNGYLYTAICEWSDAEGNVHWSEPAPPQTITLTNNSVTISFMGFSASWKDAIGTRPMRIKFYRTKEGGGTYYLCATCEGPIMGGSSLGITDNMSDATLGAQAKLYTQVGVPGAALVRRAAPAHVAIENYLGTIVLIADDQKTVWMSAQRVVGEGLWFNDVWQYPVEGDGLTAIAELDGILYLFARKAIYAVSGEPPQDNGPGGLGTIRRLAVDVGCIDARSVVKTGNGVFFRSDRGLELLERSGVVSWVGEKIRRTLDANPVITSGSVNVSRSTVTFTLATGESGGLVTGTGPRIVFDLDDEVWCSTDQVTGNGGIANTPAQHGCMVYDAAAAGYAYAWLQADGTVHVERYDSWLDDDTYFIPVSWTPAIVKAGLQQQQELWQYLLLYQRFTASGLLIEHAYNYSTTFTETKPVTEAVVATTNQIEVRPKPQTPALGVRITTTQPATLGTGQGLAIIGASFDVAPIQGPTRGTPHVPVSVRV